MRFRVSICIALLMVACFGSALADTATYDGTTYVYPGEPHQAAALTLSVTGAAFDPDTFEPVEVPSLKGAVFGVYAKDDKGNYVPFADPANPLTSLTITTDIAPVSVDLPRAVDLYLKQEAAPEGYVVAAEAEDYIPLTLPQSLSFTNRMAGMQGVWVTLVGIGGPQEMPLADVAFTLDGMGQTHKLETDAEGKASLFGIDPGTYTLTQVTTPEGYHVDTPQTEVTIREHEPSQVTLENSMNGTVTLRTLGLSLDAARETRLIPIARTYEVLDADGGSHGTLTGGEQISLPASRDGLTYTLRAIGTTTDGFTSDTQEHTVTLYPGQASTCQTVVRSEKGYFRFAHIAAEDGASVAGGTFELLDASGRTTLTFQADASGKYEPVEALLPGIYTLEMTHGAEGYLFDETSQTIEISPYLEAGNTVAEASFVSEPVPAALYDPQVQVDAQRHVSLFEKDAAFTFAFTLFDDNAPLPITGLSYSFKVAETEGMEAPDMTKDGASVRIARRLPLEGVPEVEAITASGTVAYSFSYQIDRAGTMQTVPISAPFEVTVATFAPLTQGAPFAVSGHVFDAQGALLVDHPVSVEDAKAKVVEEMNTDPFGAYAFAEMPRGAVLNFHPPEDFGVKRDGGDAHILPLRTVSGQVHVEGNLDGYPVTLQVGDEDPIAPEADGSFSITGIFDETAAVVAEAPDGVLVRTLSEGDTTTVWLYAAASVMGSVSDPDGQHVQNVLVTLEGEGESYEAKTDAYGKYAFDGLYPGEYTVMFAPPEGYVLNTEAFSAVTLTAGEEKRGVDAGAMQPAAIEGMLWDGDVPYADVPITLMPGFVEAVTAEDGSFAFEGLPVGAYTLSLGTPEDIIVLDMPGEIALNRPAQREAREIHTVRPATLSGRIWEDTNDDGLLTFDEVGLSGVEIVLHDAGETPIRTVQTDDEGVFTFDGLTPGRYRLAITLPEQMIFARSVSGTERIVAGVDLPEGVSEWYTLASGQKLDDLAAGAIMPGSIEGITWEDIDGDGILGDGEPRLAGVGIVLMQGDETLHDIATDAEGMYRFVRLRAGDYTLRITLPEGCMFTSQVQVETEGIGSRIPKSTQRAAEYPLELRRSRLDNQVHIGAQRAASLEAHIWFDTDASGVNPGSVGYAGLDVALYALNGTSETFVAQQATDASGNVRFEHVRPGSYLLRYTLPEEKGWGFTAGVARSAESTGTSAEITLANGANEKATQVGVTKLGRISGVLFEDANYDGLRGEQESGITGQVALLGADGTVLQETQTRSGGAYAFDNIPSGRYAVRFTLPDAYAFTAVRTDAPSYNSDVPETLETASQTELLFLPMGEELLIDAGAYRRASIAGMAWQDVQNNGLYAQANPPLAGIEVTLLRGEEAIATHETDEQGAYRFADLAPGEYTIEVALPEGMRFSLPPSQGGRGSMIEETEALTGQITAITLRNGESKVERDVGIVHNGAVVGSAMDYKTGGGLAGVSVTLLRGNVVELETVTAEGGAYRFEDVRPGVVEILFEAPEHWIISEEETNPVRVQVPQGAESAPAGIYCIPEATLDGTVWLDGDGDGKIGETEIVLADARVQLYAVAEEEYTLVSVTKTDDDGRYHFGDLLPGTYALRFEPATDVVFYDGDEIPPFTLNMGDGREDTVSAYIAATVNGAVWEDLDNNGLWDDGEPGLPEITVALVQPDGQVAMELVTDETGAYRFVDVPPIECAVRVTLPDSYMFTAPVEGGSVMPETDGSVAQTELMALAMGDAISGMDAGALRHTRIGDLVWLDANGNGLQDTDEAGVPGVAVALWRPGDKDALAETQTDQNGHYRFDAVRPGEYYVVFQIDAQYLPTVEMPALSQINSKLPWMAGEMLQTEAFTAQSGRFQLAIDAGLVPLEKATALGWVVQEDGTITQE